MSFDRDYGNTIIVNMSYRIVLPVINSLVKPLTLGVVYSYFVAGVGLEPTTLRL